MEEVFKTLPLADSFEEEPDTKEAIPSPLDVEYAKEWVDFNEK